MSEDQEDIVVTVRGDGTVLWNGAPIDLHRLDEKFKEAAATSPRPDLHLTGAKDVRYEHVRMVTDMAQRHGLTKVGFILGSH